MIKIFWSGIPPYGINPEGAWLIQRRNECAAMPIKYLENLNKFNLSLEIRQDFSGPIAGTADNYSVESLISKRYFSSSPTDFYKIVNNIRSLIH
jgi:hypothetical protein